MLLYFKLSVGSAFPVLLYPEGRQNLRPEKGPSKAKLAPASQAVPDFCRQQSSCCISLHGQILMVLKGFRLENYQPFIPRSVPIPKLLLQHRLRRHQSQVWLLLLLSSPNLPLMPSPSSHPSWAHKIGPIHG